MKKSIYTWHTIILVKNEKILENLPKDLMCRRILMVVKYQVYLVSPDDLAFPNVPDYPLDPYFFIY